MNGNTDIYVIPANGGKLKRVTTDKYIHSTPSWSRDGKWIYFSSNRSAEADSKVAAQIWRRPALGGDAVQITHQGRFFQQESFDGTFLYYLMRPFNGFGDPGTVMRIPVEGGTPVKIREGVPAGLWSLTRKGIFFVSRESREDAINLYRLEDGKTTTLASLPFRISQYAGGISVSEDGRWLLTVEMNRHDSDLMLIDNFM